MVWGYARVSTPDQSLDLQTDALIRAGVCRTRIFSDLGSGAKADRAGLTALLSAIEPGHTVCVWRLDRLGRSIINLADLLERFRGDGVELQSLTEGIVKRHPDLQDTATPTFTKAWSQAELSARTARVCARSDQP